MTANPKVAAQVLVNALCPEKQLKDETPIKSTTARYGADDCARRVEGRRARRAFRGRLDAAKGKGDVEEARKVARAVWKASARSPGVRQSAGSGPENKQLVSERLRARARAKAKY
jgi:hypothetical protein